MNFQTPGLPIPLQLLVTTQWLLVVCGLQQAVVEMKGCPCFRKDCVTITIWVSFLFISTPPPPLLLFSLPPSSHSTITDFQTTTLF